MPGPGTLNLEWHAAKTAKPVLVAFDARAFTGAGRFNVKIKLTSAGKRLFEHARKLKLTAKASFTPRSGGTTTRRKPFTVRR